VARSCALSQSPTIALSLPPDGTGEIPYAAFANAPAERLRLLSRIGQTVSLSRLWLLHGRRRNRVIRIKQNLWPIRHHLKPDITVGRTSTESNSPRATLQFTPSCVASEVFPERRPQDPSDPSISARSYCVERAALVTNRRFLILAWCEIRR